MLAFLLVCNSVITGWDSVTNGSSTLTGVPSDITAAGALVWSLAILCVAFAFMRTKSALRLRASRENQLAAEALGVAVVRDRIVAFVLSGLLVGIGGALYAQHLGSLDARGFYLQLTFLTIAMITVGGRNTLTGAVLGAIAIATVAEWLRQVEDGIGVGPIDFAGRPGIQEVGLAIAMLAILLARPSGLSQDREWTWPWRRPWLPSDPNDPNTSQRAERG